MEFRVYLLDTNGHVQAAHPLSAVSDAEAVELARLLYVSCDDVFSACEVWRGATRIHQIRPPLAGPVEALAALSRRRQHLALEMEETIASSFSCMRSSRKFLAEMDTLRQRILPPDSGTTGSR